MDKPILDFFDEESLINKESYTQNSHDFQRQELLNKYKINTALFIFVKEDISTVVDTNKLEEFY